jgi:hypothetical protein
MKKATPFLIACFIAGILYVGIAGCHKKKSDDNECKTCKAFGVDNNQLEEKTVCSDSEEGAFRTKYEGRRVECK